MLTYLKNARLNREEDGFTLIELLVVILIIGILAAIAIPVFLGQRQTANDAAVKSDISNAAKSMEVVLAETGTYPATLPADVHSSAGVRLAVKSADANGYCLIGSHENGKDYDGVKGFATWDSGAGGLNRKGESCADDIKIGGSVDNSGAQASGPGADTTVGTDTGSGTAPLNPDMGGMTPQPEPNAPLNPDMGGMTPQPEPGTDTGNTVRATYSREGTKTASVNFSNFSNGSEDGTPTNIPATVTFTKAYENDEYVLKADFKTEASQWDTEYFYNAQPYMKVDNIQCYPHNLDVDPYGERAYSATAYGNETLLPSFEDGVNGSSEFKANTGNCNVKSFTLSDWNYTPGTGAHLVGSMVVEFPQA